MSDENQIVITSAVRTGVASFGGTLSSTPAHELGQVVIKAGLEKSKLETTDVSEVIMGHVLTGAQGQNPARQASIGAGLSIETPAWLVNQVCGSGLRSVALGFQAIKSGDSSIVIAGGQENMSLAPHCAELRKGQKMGELNMIDSMIKDGLWDAFNGYHMGITAENVADEYDISREEQDEFALSSQLKAAAAKKAGKFKEEIVPVTIKSKRSEVIFEEDEYIREDASIEQVAKLRPAFKRDGGTVTAANASGINDGAAAVVLMTLAEAEKRGLTPLAKIVSWAQAGVDPSVMGTGPIPASKKALEKAGWSASDLDRIEANEAFAAQSCAVNKCLGWNVENVNVNGGAIAIGHPIGASGTRILVSLLHELKRSETKRGLATLCIGGGMGIAMCVETV